MNREFNQKSFESTFNKHKKLLMESISSSEDDKIVKDIEKDTKDDGEYSHSPEMRVRSDEPEPFGYGDHNESDLREDSNDDPLYVEYMRDMPNEAPFELGGKKYQFVTAKYPNGKEDIGVYAYAGDIVYGYKAWKQMNNIKAESASMGDPTGMNESNDSKCSKCKGAGSITVWLKGGSEKNNHGFRDAHIVPCDMPGCHGGIMKGEENVMYNQYGTTDISEVPTKELKKLISKASTVKKNSNNGNYFKVVSMATDELSKRSKSVNESVPPNFPSKLKNSLLKKYQTDPSKAYATMWKLSKKYGDKLDEVVVGMKSDKCDIVNEKHDETDMSNPEEKHEVEIGKEMLKLAKKLVNMHKK